MGDPLIHRTAAEGFGAAAGEYERARPSYPAEIVDAIAGHLPKGTVLDLAAGTGKFTRALVERGREVIAVEPVAEMRAKLAESLPGVQVLDGTAEAIPVDDATVAAVTVAQAFHWFRFDVALAEIARVLIHDGVLALVWNARDERVPWVKAVTEIIDPYETPDMRVHRWRRGAWREPVLGSPRFRLDAQYDAGFTHEMDVDLLVERVASTSFIAVLDDAERGKVERAVRDLAATHPDLAGRERFDFPYVCEAYVFTVA